MDLYINDDFGTGFNSRNDCGNVKIINEEMEI
jgi:hypothetical protein